MSDEMEKGIRCLDVGDIFHARAPNGASRICLATEIADNYIHARAITTQEKYKFDRSTGIAKCQEYSCTIDSIAPLPIEVHNVFLGLDRKMRLAQRLEELALSRAEKDALIFVSNHYSAHPLTSDQK